MNAKDNLQSVGGELGFEGVEHLVARAEAICECEERRITLTNQPRITGLQAEIASLAERENEIQERRRQAAPPGDERRRLRRPGITGRSLFFSPSRDSSFPSSPLPRTGLGGRAISTAWESPL